MARGEAQIGIFQPEVSADGAMPRRTIPSAPNVSIAGGLESISQGLGSIGDAWKRKQASDSAMQAMSQLADANVSLLQKSEDLKQQFPEGNGFTDAMNAEVKKTSDDLLKNAKGNPILLRHLQQGLINLGENYQTHAIQWQAAATAAYKEQGFSDNVDKNATAVEAGVMPYDQAIVQAHEQAKGLSNNNPERTLRLTKAAEQQYSLADARRIARDGPQVFVDNKDDPSKLPQSFQNLNDAQRQSIMTMARSSLAQMQGNAIAGAYSQGGERAGNQAFGTIAKMPYDDELKQMIQQQANQGITAWRQQQGVKFSDQRFAVETRLASGIPLPDDAQRVNTLRQNGVYSDETAAHMIGAMNKAAADAAEKNAGQNTIEGYLAAGIGLDPEKAKDPKTVKGVNAFFDATVTQDNLAPFSPEWQNRAAYLFDKLNVPVQSALGAARAALAGDDPKQRVGAAQFLSRMDGLAAFKGIPYDIDPRTKAQAGVIMDALQAGMPEQTAIQVSDKIHNLPDGERKRLDQQFNRAGHLTELHGINELEHALKDDPKFNTGTVFSNMPEIPLDVKTQFSTLLHDYYLQTNGNEKLATQLATNDIKASGWGVSSVNGGREWLKWAPDLRGHDVEQVRADMVAAVGDRTNDPKSVKLVPYRDTELTQGKKWNLIYTNKDGLPDALFGSNGRLRGYTPPSREDEQSAIEKKATEDAQARLAVQIQSNEKVKEQIRASQAMDEAGLPDSL